jgi:hypothetical protein
MHGTGTKLMWYHAIDLVLQVLHLCHQGRCLNPEHLVQVCSALSLSYLIIYRTSTGATLSSLGHSAASSPRWGHEQACHTTIATPHSAHFPLCVSPNNQKPSH